MLLVEDLDSLRNYPHLLTPVVTNDSEGAGMTQRLVSAGLNVDWQMPRDSPAMWYFTGPQGALVRYYPVILDTEAERFHSAMDDGLDTRIDFITGEASLMYGVLQQILGAGYRVGVRNKGRFLEGFAVFKKEGDLYVRENVITL